LRREIFDDDRRFDVNYFPTVLRFRNRFASCGRRFDGDWC